MGTITVAGQELIHRSDVPAMYHVSQAFVDRHITAKGVESVKVGRLRYVVKASLEAHLEAVRERTGRTYTRRAVAGKEKVQEQKGGFAMRTGARPCGACGLLILPDAKLARPETILALMDVWAERGRSAGDDKIQSVIRALLLMREGGRKGGKVYCVPCAKAKGI